MLKCRLEDASGFAISTAPASGFSPSFLGLPDRLGGDVTPCAVIFGAGHGSTYPGKDSSSHARAADAIRAASQEDAGLIEHWDFDLGGSLFDGHPVCCIDAGNIPLPCMTMPETAHGSK